MRLHVQLGSNAVGVERCAQAKPAMSLLLYEISARCECPHFCQRPVMLRWQLTFLLPILAERA